MHWQEFDKRLITIFNNCYSMKKIIIIALSVLALAFIIYALNSHSAPPSNELKEGDIVFQTSKSSQSKHIMLATKSQWSHCGIIVEKSDGLYVFEAITTVSLTPYQEWVNRGRGKRVSVKRYTDDPVKIKYHKYLREPYDLSFKFNNGKWYCSELIYDVYKKQLGVELCKPRLVSDYAIIGLDKVLKKRGISKDQLVVAPSDIYDSKLLREL